MSACPHLCSINVQLAPSLHAQIPAVHIFLAVLCTVRHSVHSMQMHMLLFWKFWSAHQPPPQFRCICIVMCPKSNAFVFMLCREDTASKANVDQADPDMERSCASQQQHSSSKDPAADTHLSWSRFQRFWDKLQWSRIASLQLPLSGRSHDDTAETAIAQSSRPAAARTEAATATDFATGANAHQSGYAWASSPAQLRLEQQFTKLVGTLQHSLGSAVDRLPKSAVVQGCPWPCMALTRRSALRWHVTWHGFTWPDVPQASLELQLDDCY